VELLDGLPRRLATMDACRIEIGRAAARIVAARTGDAPGQMPGERIVLTPHIDFGDTLLRR
jgi:LacI family gluconate utilization system Gnt-I transcriptional repressor